MINDALKRAKDTPPKNMPSSMAPMMPVDALAAGHGANWIRPASDHSGSLVDCEPLHRHLCRQPTGPKIIAEPAPAPAPVVHIALHPAPAPAPAVPAPMVLAANLPKPARIQGIVDDPAASLCNRQTGRRSMIGDQLDGQRVTAISPEAITLVGNGQTNQLHVGGH